MKRQKIQYKREQMGNNYNLCFRFLVLILFLLVTAFFHQAHSSFFGRDNFWNANIKKGSNGFGNEKWSSLTTVDPSKIVSILIQHGGILLSDPIKQDLKLVARFCHVEKSKLNLLEKTLILENISVKSSSGDDGNSEENDAALRIQQVIIRWDSYIKPCIEIKVNQVSIQIEFLNLLLTQNNWDALSKQGFPPTFHYEEQDDSKIPANDEEQDSFFRIGSMSLSGTTTASLYSRPLQKEIAKIEFDLNQLNNEVDREIRNQAENNLVKTGRRGCTTTELYELIQQYFGRKILGAIETALKDVTNDYLKEQKTSADFDLMDQLRQTFEQKLDSLVQEHKPAVEQTKESITKYVASAGKLTGKQLGQQVGERLEEMGLFQYAKRLSQAQTQGVQPSENDNHRGDHNGTPYSSNSDEL